MPVWTFFFVFVEGRFLIWMQPSLTRTYWPVAMKASYRKVMYKSSGLCENFQLFGSAFIQVRTICIERSLVRCDMYYESETWLRDCHKTVSKCKQFGMRNAVEFCRRWTKMGRHFQAAGSISSAVYVQQELGKRVASVWVRLLYTAKQIGGLVISKICVNSSKRELTVQFLLPNHGTRNQVEIQAQPLQLNACFLKGQ